jgi:hypothetical protein
MQGEPCWTAAVLEGLSATHFHRSPQAGVIRHGRRQPSRHADVWQPGKDVIVTENKGVRGVEILNEIGDQAIVVDNEPGTEQSAPTTEPN